MKKYRHKKTGVIAEINELDQNYHFERISGEYSSLEYLHKSFVEGSNDWEEVIKLVTEVKRNRDGAIFKIGEKVKSVDDILTIKYFTHNGDFVYFKEVDEHDSTDNLVKIEEEPNPWYIEKKTPIYTTTDGSDIYEGDKPTLYLLKSDLTFNINHTIPIFRGFSKQDKEVADRYLTFTSEENRDKYIKENSKKPIFMSADGKEMFEGYRYYVPQMDFSDKLTGTYLEFITDTRTVSHGPKKFSTKSAAQEYIDNNKPKFSLADVEKAIMETAKKTQYLSGHEIISELKKLGK